jgi:hypothetical protein
MLLEGDNCVPELVQPVCPPRCGGETPPDEPIEDVPDVPDEGGDDNDSDNGNNDESEPEDPEENGGLAGVPPFGSASLFISCR